MIFYIIYSVRNYEIYQILQQNYYISNDLFCPYIFWVPWFSMILQYISPHVVYTACTGIQSAYKPHIHKYSTVYQDIISVYMMSTLSLHAVCRKSAESTAQCRVYVDTVGQCKVLQNWLIVKVIGFWSDTFCVAGWNVENDPEKSFLKGRMNLDLFPRCYTENSGFSANLIKICSN